MRLRVFAAVVFLASFLLASDSVSAQNTDPFVEAVLPLVEGVEMPMGSFYVDFVEADSHAGAAVDAIDANRKWIRRARRLSRGLSDGAVLPAKVRASYIEALRKILSGLESAETEVGSAAARIAALGPSANEALEGLEAYMTSPPAELPTDLPIDVGTDTPTDLPTALPTSVAGGSRLAPDIRMAQAPAGIQSLLDPFHTLADSVTDISVVASETGPSVVAIRGQVKAALVQAIETYYVDLHLAGSREPRDSVVGLWTSLGLVRSYYNSATALLDGVYDSVDALVPGVEAAGCEVYKRQAGWIYVGTPSGETCNGHAGTDIFLMRGGGDTVEGRGNHDRIHLGNGDDLGKGETGPDHLWGGKRGDVMYGGYGHDTVIDEVGVCCGEAINQNSGYGGPGHDFADIDDGDCEDYWFAGENEDPEPEYDWGCHPDWPPPQDTIDMGN